MQRLISFFIGLLKLISGILVIPLVYGLSIAFFNELSTIDPEVERLFLLGVSTYAVIHLLVVRFSVVYQKGQELLQTIFSFSYIAATLSAYLVPVYAVTLFLIYLIAGYILNVDVYLNLLLFFLGFSVALHFILGAEDLKTRQKLDYFVGIMFIWIFSLIIVGIIFHFLKTGFYFHEFIKYAWGLASDTYIKAYHKIVIAISNIHLKEWVDTLKK